MAAFGATLYPSRRAVAIGRNRRDDTDLPERLLRVARERELVAVVVEMLVEPAEHVGALARIRRPARRDHPEPAVRERLMLRGRMKDRRVDGIRDDDGIAQ